VSTWPINELFHRTLRGDGNRLSNSNALAYPLASSELSSATICPMLAVRPVNCCPYAMFSNLSVSQITPWQAICSDVTPVLVRDVVRWPIRAAHTAADRSRIGRW
jgi:hypothetical protein